MTEQAMSGGGYSVFHETMADMTYPEVVEAARAGAVVLWAIGVIEQHGPHMPLGTDVYIPYALLRRARTLLAERGIASIQMPPFYWGVNHTTGMFPGTFEVRPQIMVELMTDLIKSLDKDGFTHLFCLSGHGDLVHNRTIAAALAQAARTTAVEPHFVCNGAMRGRLRATDPEIPDSLLVVMENAAKATPFLDIHAGEIEGSALWGVYPGLVREDIIRTLKSTDFGPDDLAEWRQGREHSLRKTPLGYIGDPAASDPAAGADTMRRQAVFLADAIAGALRGSTPQPAA